jgi:cyclopropane-fatty-acyl-phospholipid synthase
VSKSSAGARSAAVQLSPFFESLVGAPVPIDVDFWDGSSLGSGQLPARLVVRRPSALRRIVYAPGELGFARAFVLGDIDVEGDLHEALRLLNSAAPDFAIGWQGWAGLARSAVALRVIGPPLAPPPEEARIRGRRHSAGRDAAAIAHHYDVSNEFYRLFLGSSMTYSCARFIDAGQSLEEGQEAKYELVSRKLGLEPGMRLLDVGCGWGGMVMHAARNHGVEAVGITISRQQHDLALKRVAEAGLSDRVEIRLQDYRAITGEQFDAVSSIGMAEHVGRAQLPAYFAALAGLLRPTGRLLNHAISTPNGVALGRRTFMHRYVFPDGELPDVAEIVTGMQDQGLDVRDVEGLREHYALTLRCWWHNLDRSWDEACRLVGERRARVWRLYLAASAVSFETADIGIHQVLGVRLTPAGASGLPLTRSW